VNGVVLTLLALILGALLVAGVAEALSPARLHRHWGYATAWLAATAALLCLATLVLDPASATLRLPIGLPGRAFRLTLDPPSALFGMLVFTAGAAASAFVVQTKQAEAPIIPLPVSIAALGLAVLAGDSLARGFGIALAGFGLWTHASAAHRPYALLAIVLLAAASVIVGDELPPSARMIALLIGPGALAALLAFQLHRLAPHAGAMLAGAMIPTALYCMLRLLVGQPGPTRIWWSVPFLLLGSAQMLVADADSLSRPEIDTALAGCAARQTGLVAIGFGLVLAARAADLPGAGATAMAAVLLLAALQAFGGTLLPLIAGAIESGAGTRRLNRLGGLIHPMPVSAACLLVSLANLSALPPGGGFAALWLLFQSVLAVPRAGPPLFQLILLLPVAGMGLGAALSSAALVRLAGVVCLGRPRTPRAAAANEAPFPARRLMLALAGGMTAVGIFIGPLLRLVFDAPVRSLSGVGLRSYATITGLAAGDETPGYPALPVAVLLVMAGGTIIWLCRRARRSTGTLTGPTWNDGFSAPPAWLPFGDPLTQSGGAAFAPFSYPLPRLVLERPRLPRVRTPALVLAVVAVLLLLCAWKAAQWR
jgi:formate hydrogenlyase subunit 3/multisubunit Na+/H+ antiporter MnhD subunit